MPRALRPPSVRIPGGRVPPLSSVDAFARSFLALGPPAILLFGAVATAIGAARLTGAGRWWALGLGPLSTFVLAVSSTWAVTTFLQPPEGGGFLLGGMAIGLFAVLLPPYYLVLALFGARAFMRGD